MADIRDKPEGRKDMINEAAKLLADMAEKGELIGCLRLTADIFGEEALKKREAAGSSRPKRRPAFGIRLPRRTKRRRLLTDAENGILLWGYGLVCAMHNAFEGGRATRLYLTTGRKAPSESAVLTAIALFRQAGLTARLKDRRSDARVVTISF